MLDFPFLTRTLPVEYNLVLESKVNPSLKGTLSWPVTINYLWKFVDLCYRKQLLLTLGKYHTQTMEPEAASPSKPWLLPVRPSMVNWEIIEHCIGLWSPEPLLRRRCLFTWEEKDLIELILDSRNQKWKIILASISAYQVKSYPNKSPHPQSPLPEPCRDRRQTNPVWGCDLPKTALSVIRWLNTFYLPA